MIRETLYTVKTNMLLIAHCSWCKQVFLSLFIMSVNASWTKTVII